MFKFKGISTEKMKVICEEEDNLIARASRKYETTEIEGQDGSTYNLLGYSDVERPIKLYVKDLSKLDDILSWLDGEGILEYRGRQSYAYFLTSVSPSRLSSIKTIECNFIRSPFWYKANDYFITVENNVFNMGNKESQPIIRLVKKQDSYVDVTINDVNFIYNFGNEDYVDIDCKTYNACFEDILKNNNLQIGFDFPVLNPGNNKVIINSGNAKIMMKRRDCWL